MSKMGDHRIEGCYDFVVPPLEGFWWQDGMDGVDYTEKSAFNGISVIRLPDFVTKADFDWAVAEATRKKKLDCSMAEYLTIDKGECVRIMHPVVNRLCRVLLEKYPQVHARSTNGVHRDCEGSLCRWHRH